MRFRRAIIIPAILTLSAAGSILASSAAPAAAAQATAVHAQHTTQIIKPLMHYHA